MLNLAFYVGSGDLNSGSYDCVAKPTETSLHLCSPNIFIRSLIYFYRRSPLYLINSWRLHLFNSCTKIKFQYEFWWDINTQVPAVRRDYKHSAELVTVTHGTVLWWGWLLMSLGADCWLSRNLLCRLSRLRCLQSVMVEIGLLLLPPHRELVVEHFKRIVRITSSLSLCQVPNYIRALLAF